MLNHFLRRAMTLPLLLAMGLPFSLDHKADAALKRFGQAGGPAFGVVTSVHQDTLLRQLGFAGLEENTQSSFSPLQVSWEQYQRIRERIRLSQVPVYSCNVFLPGKLKLVGPGVDEGAVLGYADSVFRRAAGAGLTLVVLGSGEARRIPAGFSTSEARQQFVALVRKMGVLAQAYGLVLAMENLNRGETNLGNSLSEVVSLIREINHPAVRVTADLYHMLKEDESAQSVLDAGPLLVHGHIAEERDRARPGKYREDFTPYFRAMRAIGFSGRIMIEGSWGNLATEGADALRYLREQWGQ